jgi:uncharacterized protein YjbI with pentapeptide repeats
MRGLSIDKRNLSSVNWEADCFKYCEFIGITPDGCHITADFTDCLFQDVDWYWGLFNVINFVGCKFVNCAFRGTSFSECRFVECEFMGCRFVQDNLGGECSFNRSVAYNCHLADCEGFRVVQK